MLDPGRGRTKTGQLWAYARDDRPFGGADPPLDLYVYAPNQKAKQPIAHVADFAGVLQVEGYAGYRALATRAAKSIQTDPDALETWLRSKLALISQMSKLAEAIHYALSR